VRQRLRLASARSFFSLAFSLSSPSSAWLSRLRARRTWP